MFLLLELGKIEELVCYNNGAGLLLERSWAVIVAEAGLLLITELGCS